MKTLAGLWISHWEAVIVLMSQTGQETRRIKSCPGKQLQRSSGSPSGVSFEPQMNAAGDSGEPEDTGGLTKYYDEVISCLRHAEALMVFGPGEEKGELRKRLKRYQLDLRITRFETSGKMTESQVSQKVRRHYLSLSCNVSPSGGKRR
jgi:hypothetical protein